MSGETAQADQGGYPSPFLPCPVSPRSHAGRSSSKASRASRNGCKLRRLCTALGTASACCCTKRAVRAVSPLARRSATMAALLQRGRESLAGHHQKRADPQRMCRHARSSSCSSCHKQGRAFHCGWVVWLFGVRKVASTVHLGLPAALFLCTEPWISMYPLLNIAHSPRTVHTQNKPE